MHRSIIYLKVPGIGNGEKKNPFIRFIAYCIPIWIFPQHIKAASPCRKLCPRGLASSAPCPSFGTQEGGITPSAPKSLLSHPWGATGQLPGHCQPPGCSRSREGVCTLLPRKHAPLLGQYFAFWSILGWWCQVGAQLKVPAPVVLLEGPLCHGHQKALGYRCCLNVSKAGFFIIAFLLFITIL